MEGFGIGNNAEVHMKNGALFCTERPPEGAVGSPSQTPLYLSTPQVSIAAPGCPMAPQSQQHCWDTPTAPDLQGDYSGHSHSVTRTLRIAVPLPWFSYTSGVCAREERRQLHDPQDSFFKIHNIYKMKQAWAHVGQNYLQELVYNKFNIFLRRDSNS